MYKCKVCDKQLEYSDTLQYEDYYGKSVDLKVFICTHCETSYFEDELDDERIYVQKGNR